MAHALTGDPFFEQFFGRVAPEISARFTRRQMAAIKSVFGDATHAGHLVDVRVSLPFPFTRRGVYMVFLVGRDRRDARQTTSGRRSIVARVLGRVIGFLFLIQVALAIAAVIYMLT